MLFFRILYHTFHSLMHLFTHACIHTCLLTCLLTHSPTHTRARAHTHTHTHTRARIHSHTHTHTEYRHVHSHVYSMYKHPRVKYSIYIALLCYHTLRQDSCMLLVRQVCMLASLSRKLTVCTSPIFVLHQYAVSLKMEAPFKLYMPP